MTNITRREFLRVATLMGGASLFAGCNLLGQSEPVPEYIQGAPGSDPIETLAGIRNIYTVCGLCPVNCGICCRVAQGAVVKIGGSPYHPVSADPPLPFDTPLDQAASVGASVCAVGGSGIQTLYDPFRVAKPLKRVGPRGSGKWTALAWDQAISEITTGGNLFQEGQVAGLSRLKASGSGLGFMAGSADWGSLTFIKKFLSAFPGASMIRDHAYFLNETARQAAAAVFGARTGMAEADYANARFLLSIGDAPLDSGVPLASIARDIANARVNGPCLRWAVVDPRLSTSASKADMWVPIIPGTDVNLALGIMKALLENHRAAIRIAPEVLEAVTAGRTPADFAKACGLSPEIPVKLAGLLAKEGPKAAVIPGRGVVASPDGLEAAKAILTLNLAVGSVPGTGGLVARDDAFLKASEKKLLGSSEPATAGLGSPLNLLFLWQADPVYEAPASASAYLKDSQKVQLLVAVSTHITESAALADYILPDTTFLERWDVCASPPSVAAPGIGVRIPVVGGFDNRSGAYFPILPETKPMEEIVVKLAAALALPGFEPDRPTSLKNAWDYYRKAIPAVLESMKESGLSVSNSAPFVEQVLERGGVFAASPKQAYREAGKEKRTDYKPAAVKAGPEVSAAKDNSLILIAYTLPFHRPNISGLNSWLLEVLPENKLLINSVDARKSNLQHSDSVFVETTDGKLRMECRVQIVPGIRPGVVALARGFGYNQAGVTAQAIDGQSISADKTRGAGANTSLLTEAGGLLRVRVKKA